MTSDTVLSLARRIRLAVFDVDGVLTDGRLVLGLGGEEFKAFNVRDGHGLVMLRDTGVALGVITGRRSEVVGQRMRDLGIEHVYQGQQNKLEALDALLSKTRIELADVCYVGDDLPDLGIMQRVGLPIAVADADPRIGEVALWRTLAPGGSGAVREVCELIMQAQGTLAGRVNSHAAPRLLK